MGMSIGTRWNITIEDGGGAGEYSKRMDLKRGESFAKLAQEAENMAPNCIDRAVFQYVCEVDSDRELSPSELEALVSGWTKVDLYDLAFSGLRSQVSVEQEAALLEACQRRFPCESGR